jgi:hypothetical protein
MPVRAHTLAHACTYAHIGKGDKKRDRGTEKGAMEQEGEGATRGGRGGGHDTACQEVGNTEKERHASRGLTLFEKQCFGHILTRHIDSTPSNFSLQ